MGGCRCETVLTWDVPWLSGVCEFSMFWSVAVWVVDCCERAILWVRAASDDSASEVGEASASENDFDDDDDEEEEVMCVWRCTGWCR